MNGAAATTAGVPPKRYANYYFTLLFLVYMFDYIDRTIVTSLLPFIKKDWGITDAQSGMLVSAIYWAIVVLIIPMSILVDRWSRKKTIGMMAVFWSLATAACAFTRNFPQLLAARVAIGVGESGYAPAGTALISGLFPPEKRSRMVGIWNASIPLGSAIGVLVGGWVAVTWGWRHAFGLVALPGLIVAFLFFFTRDYKTVDLTKTVAARKVKMTKWEIFMVFIKTPTLVLANLGFAGVIFVTTSLLTWLPTYFHRIENLPMNQAGMKSSAIMILAIIGAPLGGIIADWWLKKRINVRLLFPAISTLLSALVLFIGVSFLEGQARFLTLLLMGVLIIAFSPGAIAVTQDVVHPGLRAISYAVCAMTQNILGASIGPVVIGRISDVAGIQAAMAIMPLFLVAASLLFYAGSFFYERDLAKAEKVDLQWE